MKPNFLVCILIFESVRSRYIFSNLYIKIYFNYIPLTYQYGSVILLLKSRFDISLIHVWYSCGADILSRYLTIFEVKFKQPTSSNWHFNINLLLDSYCSEVLILKFQILMADIFWTKFFNPFIHYIPLMVKPWSWFALVKCLKNTCGKRSFK